MINENNQDKSHGYEPFEERLMYVLRTSGELAPEREDEVTLVESEITSDNILPESLLDEVALSNEIISAKSKIVEFDPNANEAGVGFACAARLGKGPLASIEKVLRGDFGIEDSLEKPKVETTSHISRERKMEIVSLSESIFDSHQQAIPVEPLQILLDEGLTYSFGHYGDLFDGLIECRNQHFHIYCNRDRGNDESSPRTRFTIAHELGHYFIDEHRWGLQSGKVRPHGSLFGGPSGNHQMEKEANLFAASLLVPSRQLLKIAPKLSHGLQGIVEVASFFDVSVQCAAIQVAEADIESCAVFFWNEKGYRWKWSSPCLYAAGYRRGIKDRSLIPADSATGLALGHKDTGIHHMIYKNNTVASSWFPGIRAGSNEDIILREEALCLGSFGVLTVLCM